MRLRSLFFLLVCAFALSGCAHYKMGDTSALPFKSVYVAPVENASLAPQAQAALSAQTRVALTQAGLALEPRGQADAILTICIDRYSRTETTTNETDTMDVNGYDLTLGASITLKSADGQTVYFKDLKETATLQIRAAQGMQQAEYQIMPLLARELGRKIKDAVVTIW